MGWYDEHLEAVAKRRSYYLEMLGEKKERKLLEKCGWNAEEIERIIKIEKENLNRIKTSALDG